MCCVFCVVYGKYDEALCLSICTICTMFYAGQWPHHTDFRSTSRHAKCVRKCTKHHISYIAQAAAADITNIC